MISVDKPAFRQLLRTARALACLWAAALSSQLLFSQEVTEDPAVARLAPAATLPAAANLHLVFREDFLNRLVAGDTVQTGEVRDTFEDTQITGKQVTETHFKIDLMPSNTHGRAWIVLDGDVNSNTQGFSQKAIVNTLGHQQFHAIKEILFDGYQLSTRHAQISVRADNQNIGAVTPFTGRPLGPFVEQVILNFAEARKTAANEFARQRIADQIYPRFDGDTDQKLAEGNRLLKNQVQPWLKAAKAFPDQLRVISTDTHGHLAASVAAALDRQSPPPVPGNLVAEHGVVLYVHESLPQGLVERLDLAGKKVNSRDLLTFLNPPDPQVEVETEKSLGGLPDLNVHIEFADVDPLVIEFGEEVAHVVMRASFQVGEQELLPPLEISLAVRLVPRDNLWELKPIEINVRHLDGTTTGTSLAELAVKKVIEANLTKRTFPRRLPANLWPAGKTPPELASIRAGSGWLVIGVD